MITVHDTQTLRQHIRSYHANNKRVSFVPTMGNLHEGHLSLIDEAHKHTDIVVTSIFVNPMQFGENEDLDAYPRTLAADSEALESRQCDILFAPSVSEVYPNGTQAETKVDVPSLGKHHCGASREGHFIGVATIVCKLFNMVQADVAIFGQKDFQQLAIIRKMVKDLCIPLKIIGVETSREPSGLARSSRNGYLSADEKQKAATLYQSLLECKQAIQNGNTNYQELTLKTCHQLEVQGFKPDYFNISNPETLECSVVSDQEFVILVAAYLGTTRLIDNIYFTV